MINSVTICGNITREIEVKTGQSGKRYCNFTVALNNGQNKEADFINCTAFEATADYLGSYIRKGDKVVVNGSIKNRTWENQNGKQTMTYVMAFSVEGMSKQHDQQPVQQQVQPTQQQYAPPQYNQPSLGGDLQRPEERNEFTYADIKTDDLPFY